MNQLRSAHSRGVVSSAANLLLLCCCYFFVPAASQNIDIQQPVLRQVDGLPSDSLFGYSLVLHQTLTDTATDSEYLDGVRIVVSAPRGTAPEGSVPNTGLVYACPVSPGDCTPLSGKLFDITPNDLLENKTDQFLGGSMTSNGERFMVCAHRYVVVRLAASGMFPYILGKCFYTTGRALENFQEYQPCSVTNTLFACQAGTSSAIVPDGADTYAFGVGTPGANYWAGGLFRLSSSGQSDSRRNTNGNDYDGYSTIGGRFLTPSRQDFAVSLPRSNNYLGSVNLVSNDNNLQVTSQPLSGVQMGEYYGFSLLAADLNGDGYDDLLVGAPLYRANSTEPETGRVFIYQNDMGNLRLLRTIEGRMRYSRFGYAMANLGDINGDGFDDVAISAPFTETGTSEPGTVFIYHSTPTLLLTLQPQQIIRGDALHLSQDLSGLRGFGTSLASGVDVDSNSYNDLLIGSFLSQQVFLLRTHPIANIHTTVTADPLIVDVFDTTKPDCMLNGVSHSCFNVTACATYGGRGLTPSLNLNYTLIGDIRNIEQRILFENGASLFTLPAVTLQIGVESCVTTKAFVRENVMDIFNPFVMEMRIEAPSREVAIGNGNETLTDLSGFPIITFTGASEIQVETLKECGGIDVDCTPDLRINVTDIQTSPTDDQQSSPSIITAGLTQSLNIFVNIENALEDAFQSTLSFTLPSNQLKLVNVFNQTGRGEVTLRCITDTLSDDGTTLDFSRHSCSIGNPFNGPGNLRLRVELDPANDIVGNENAAFINFTVDSINAEDSQTVGDNSNFAVVQLTFEARANITIDNGFVTPEIVSYSDNATLNGSTTDLLNVPESQLGPPVDVSFLIRNTGPSRIPNAQLNLLWPLSGTLTGDFYYLYITSIQSNGVATVMCTNEYINPRGLTTDEDRNNQEGDPTVNMGNGRRRKRRSTVKRTLKKRQDVPSGDEDVSQNVTLSCMLDNPLLTCVNIQCNILGLPGSSSVQIDINARLDERFFSTSNDHFTLIPTASISIVNGDFIQSNNGSSQRSADALIRVFPAARVPTVGDSGPSGVPWYAIVAPIAAALIVFIIAGILLWVFGFFRRNKHEEIKQKREELQALDDFGMTPTEHEGATSYKVN